MSAKPELHVISSTATGGGRPKQPLEKRKMLSDNPHKNRKGPPDVEMSAVVKPDELPVKPPKRLSKLERECWNLIAETQTGRHSKWIYRSDCSYLIATCVLYGRLMEVRDEINLLRDAGCSILEADSMKANPLYALEAQLAVKYQASLRDLGLVPTRRQVTLKQEDGDNNDGLLR